MIGGIWDLLVSRHPVVTAYVFVLGACIGSFANACAYRIPREIGLSDERSFCPLCGARIRWSHNIPICSWLWLRGRCADCGGRISVLYPIVELLGGVLFAALYARHGLPLASAYWVLTGMLLIGMRTDIEWQIIPDRVTLGGFAAGVAFSAVLPGLHGADDALAGVKAAVIGGAVCAASLYLVAWLGTRMLKKEAMGLGDVKLMLCFGAFLGWQGGVFSAMAGSVLGAVLGVGCLWVSGRKWGTFMAIPFGPPLMLGAWIWMLGGREGWNAYLSDAEALSFLLAP
ncbi:MAG: prepilin peptidase [Verrucomicrobiae bacterium]|nr:prepilin peptidase [Verrucomicrobiae bacterium]